jgi:hypothetical protein
MIENQCERRRCKIAQRLSNICPSRFIPQAGFGSDAIRLGFATLLDKCHIVCVVTTEDIGQKRYWTTVTHRHVIYHSTSTLRDDNEK